MSSRSKAAESLRWRSANARRTATPVPGRRRGHAGADRKRAAARHSSSPLGRVTSPDTRSRSSAAPGPSSRPTRVGRFCSPGRKEKAAASISAVIVRTTGRVAPRMSCTSAVEKNSGSAAMSSPRRHRRTAPVGWRAAVLSLGEEHVPDVARRRRKSGTVLGKRR
jgi:hypothetical protein